MIDLKLAITLGSILEQIRKLLEETESMYFGIFINSLMYDDEEDGKRKKDEFKKTLSNQIRRINKKVKSFNFIIDNTLDKDIILEKLPLVNFVLMQRIINDHKDFPHGKGKEYLKELVGEADSASTLSRTVYFSEIKKRIVTSRD